MKNNFEALMPLIAKYVEEHLDEYKKYLEQKENEKRSVHDDIPLPSDM